MTATELKKDIEGLWIHVKNLREKYPKYQNRPFTVDGHLLGTLGEIYVAEKLGLQLNKSAKKDYDATKDGINYQIKITQTRKVCFKNPLRNAELIIIKIDKDKKGDPQLIVYQVSGTHINWNNASPTYVGVRFLDKLCDEKNAQKEVF